MHSWNRNYVNNKIGMKSHLNLLERPLSLEQFQITGMENWKPICVTFSDKNSNGSDVCTTDQCARGVSVYFRLASTSKHDFSAMCLRGFANGIVPSNFNRTRRKNKRRGRFFPNLLPCWSLFSCKLCISCMLEQLSSIVFKSTKEWICILTTMIAPP